MKENNIFLRKNDGDSEIPRETHAAETLSTQTSSSTSNKRVETMLAGAASLTLVAFLLALWKIIA